MAAPLKNKNHYKHGLAHTRIDNIGISTLWSRINKLKWGVEKALKTKPIKKAGDHV